MNTDNKLTPAMQAKIQMQENTKLHVAIVRHQDQIVMRLGEIFGFDQSERTKELLNDNIARIASKWVRQWNRWTKRQADLKTIGKQLGIRGTERDVKERLSLFRFFYTQYKDMDKVRMASSRLALDLS